MTARRSQRIEIVRRFNRFYAHCLGELEDVRPNDSFSPTEIRVLFELAGSASTTATELNRRLCLDAGYLSRILHRFERSGFLSREIGRRDRRELRLGLTPAGRAVIIPLDRAVIAEVTRWLQSMNEQKQRELLSAMQAIMQLLGDAEA
jgi:DNA-binding MarR family transcriptional regulator